MRTMAGTDPGVIGTMRTLLLVVLAVSMAGSAADLLLIEHYEEPWQVAPLAVFAAGLATAGWAATSGAPGAVLAMRIVMTLAIASGVVGVLLHFGASREFQQEIDPALAGWALVVKSVTAKAPPALAPGVMIQIGLLGLLYTYRHPALTRAAQHAHGEPERTGA